MRRESYIRRTSYTDKFYELWDKYMPVKPSFNAIIAAIVVVFVLFAMTCFAAATYSSSASKLETSMQNAEKTTNYYDAETVASEIIAILSAGKESSITDKNGELIYESPRGDITVSRNGGNFSFDVPVDKKESLHVIAKITGGNVKIIQWRLRS